MSPRSIYNHLRRILQKWLNLPQNTFPHSPIISGMRTLPKTPEDVLWPPQTQDLQQAIEMVKLFKERNKNTTTKDPLKEIYQDILDGLKGVEKDLKKKRKKGQYDVIDIQNK